MNFSKEIKKLRLDALLTQENFANELGVTGITVNRWETGKTRPTIMAMRKIDEFCKKNSIDFDIREFVGKSDE